MTGGHRRPGRCVPDTDTTGLMPASAAACQLHSPAEPISASTAVSIYNHYDLSWTGVLRSMTVSYSTSFTPDTFLPLFTFNLLSE